MKQPHRLIIFFFLIFLSLTCAAQDSTSSFYLKEVRMHIRVPKDFITEDSLEDIKDMERGKKMIEESNNVTADISDTKVLLSARKGQYNYLNVTATPYKNGNAKWQEENKVMKDLLFNTFQQKMPDAVMDSSSAFVTIDGVVFDRFRITVKINESATMKMYLFSNLYNGYDLGITYLFINPAIGIQLQKMVMESTFDKSKH